MDTVTLESLYQPLPDAIQEAVFGTSSNSKADNEKKFDNLLKDLKKLKSNNLEDLLEGLEEKSIHIIAEKEPEHKPTPHFKKTLSFKERRRLGLYSLKKKLKFKDFLALHELWKQYMRSYIDLDTIREQGWNNSPEDKNFEQVSMKLYRADYHGCLTTVVRSPCPNYVGISGIIVMETKNVFRLLGQDDFVRTVPKSICEFSINLDEFQFRVYGKNFVMKPAERSRKKVKTVWLPDI